MIGGPVGTHAGRHRWWTPVRVLLALTVVCFALGLVQKSELLPHSGRTGPTRYAQMCYSDLPYLYTGRGFVELAGPTPTPAGRARYQVMEYPVGISYFAWGTRLGHPLAQRARRTSRTGTAARRRPWVPSPG